MGGCAAAPGYDDPVLTSQTTEILIEPLLLAYIGT